MATFRSSLFALLLAACPSPKAPKPLPPLPHTAYAHYLDGKLAAYRDDWPSAADALAQAAAAAPDQPMVAVELARAQWKAKRPEAARATLAAARTKWPRHAQVWLASGDAMAPGTPAEAIKAYRRAIDLEPTDERAYLGLAKLEDPQRALSTLRRLVKKAPDSVDGRYRLAQRLSSVGKLGDAIAQLREVLERDPDHIDARLDLSRALRQQGQLVEAIGQTRSAFDRSGQALDVAEELYWLLCEADDRTAAIDLLTLLDDDRSDTEALATVARLERGLGRLDDARAVAQRLVKVDAELGALVLAEVEIVAGDRASALKRALAIPDTSDRFLDARRVAAAAAAGEPQKILDLLAPARAAKPTDVDLATLTAFALVDLKKPNDAIALMNTLDGASALFAKARVADHAGDTRTALEIVEAIIRAKADSTSALNLAGYILADKNERLADAERYLRRARQLSPGDPAILDSWGWLRFRQGKTREAVRILDRAARFSPLEPEILVHLAAAWAADGAPRTALTTLDKAAALRPPAAVQQRIDTLRSTLARAR
ncbi:MAG: tetratricopeptide repeat protein [Myxococcota bacterium]|nr:tetratricopeptide repeat protein [Myxococcota bacterium]